MAHPRDLGTYCEKTGISKQVDVPSNSGQVSCSVSTLISSVAHFVPPATVGNSDLAARLGVTADWIVRRTRIHERRIAESGGTSDLIIPAAQEWLRRVSV